MKHIFNLILSVILLSLSAASTAREIKIVVPFAAGGTNDLVAKQVQRWLSEDLQQTVTTEFKLGNSGDIATTYVASAPSPDVLLLVQSSSIVVNNVIPHTRYNLENDLSSVAYVGYTPLVIVSQNKFNIKSACNSTALNIGASGGLTSATGINAAVLNHSLNECGLAIPFKGSAEMVTNLLGNHIDVGISFLSTAEQHINTGSLNAVAVISDHRLQSLPAVPTVKELNLNGNWFQAWIAVFTNSSADPETVKKIKHSLAKMINNPEEQKKLLAIGVVGEPNKISSTDSIVKTEITKFQKSKLKNLLSK